MLAGRSHAPEQAAVCQLLEEHERGAARQQIAAVRCAVIAQRDGGGDAGADERRADGHAAAERLADRHQVGLEAECLRVKRLAGAAQPALHFVGDQQRAGRRRDVPHGPRERRRDRPHAALALDRLQDHGGGVGGHGRPERVRIEGRHPGDARHHRREGRAVVLVPGHRQRAERAAVERVLERDEPRARRALRVPVTPGELQARLDRFGPAVADERALEARQRRETRGQRRLQGVVKEVRRVHQRCRLIGDRGGQARVSVAERGHADARQQVEIRAPVGVVQPDAFTAHEDHGRAAVGLEDVGRVERRDRVSGDDHEESRRLQAADFGLRGFSRAGAP